MTPNETIEKVKAMCAKHPPLRDALQAAFDRVCAKIEARAIARRPKPKVFEVHHETQVARLALMEAVAAGRAPESGEVEALERIGLA